MSSTAGTVGTEPPEHAVTRARSVANASARRDADGPWRSELRFDAVAVELDRAGRLVRLEHLEDAF